MAQLRVLVVGASIAGPTTAYWLAKAGAKVTVIERFPELRKGGQNIDIRTAGVSVMRKMPGMEAAVRSKFMEIDGISIVDNLGAPYGVLRATGNPDQQSLVSEFEIFRGDLAKILYDLTKDNENIEYVFGEQIASMQQDESTDGPMKVDFMNGKPSAEYDLVAACDGATSRTRAMGLGCGVRDNVESTNCWAAYFSVKNDVLKGGRTGKAISAPGGKFFAVGPDPWGANRIVLMAMQPRDGVDRTRPFREAVKQGDDATKRYVAEYYRGAGWVSDEIMEEVHDADDFYASEMIQVKQPTFSKGRFVMVGDAGYACSLTGGGTSVALMGAYTLAGQICKHKNDLPTALKEYETAMRPLVTEMQKIPPGIATFMAPQTAWGIAIRNRLFGVVAYVATNLGWIMGYLSSAFASTAEYKLPEYPWVA